MKTNVIKTVFQIVFVCVIGFFLFGSLFRTYLFPKEINYYENRKANQPPIPTISSFLSSEFQNALDNAFADQVFYSGSAKKLYNETESKISHKALYSIYEANPNKYFKYNDVNVFNTEHLLFSPRFLNDINIESISLRADQINNLTAEYPELDFYTFYIEKDTDNNFETGEKSGIYQYIESVIDTSRCGLGVYEIDNFEEFSEKFFKTDHHWNHKGAYDGYLTVCDLLGIDDPLEKGEEFLVADKMTGSKLALAKDYESWSEPMYAYKYEFPPMDVYSSGEKITDFGNQNKTKEEFLQESEVVSYGLYFGGDLGEAVFDTGNTDKENILIVGESYDNAILKLLATHFNKTYSVDLRYYEHANGAEFDFDSYVKSNSIDKVLLIGNLDYFVMEDFNIGG